LLSRAQSGGNFVAMEEVRKQQTKKKTKKVRMYKGAKEFFWGVGMYRQS
jgi:hypothetical protein